MHCLTCHGCLFSFEICAGIIERNPGSRGQVFWDSVAIVEPGIIDTPMAQHITLANNASNYSHQTRLAVLFAESLKHPVPPSLVANKIFEIYTSGTWQLRHLVGPDAAPFIGWRQSMSDEAWADLGALEEKDWYARTNADFGMNMQPKG